MLSITSIPLTNWREHFQEIVTQTREGILPVIVSRTDDPKQVDEMRNYLNKQNACIYIKLGIACSAGQLYEILANRFTPKHNSKLKNNSLQQNIQKIAYHFKENQICQTIIFDNCHHISKDQIFVLIGLLLESTGFAKFVLIFPEDLIEKWFKKITKSKGNLFQKLLSCHYAVV